ncbi:hypothetical protein H7849_20030 [Alloacidobacterium dinghuense]|uniref:Uncharacterized protein n=1 Tax=Alloacidobacterium dinghuense TaxID=2763107 RepID=A0A7G8BFM9_9BACT|nr:hypothetical protein [Alloacidobacterium dinghuense]QNI31349.1 hypothetical protein H7849_20030 [Alloacidobacterium dinghuense]
MRRLLAISLLMVFSFSLISPLLASDAVNASLPACCRRAGKHHCAMDADTQQGKSISIIAEKCPYAPAAQVVFHLSIFAPPADAAVFAGLTQHPAIHAQTAARYRISFDRSRQKRGPPSLILL